METAHIVTDLSFGDAGKGTTVDYLARQTSSVVVVRYNGGAQALHNVVAPGGQHHGFSQFGSGTFAKGVATHLSRYMMVNPAAMLVEADHLISLGVPAIWQRLTVDGDAPVIMPWHRAATRLRELARGANRHGSVGVGISEVQRDLLADPELVVRVGDLFDSFRTPQRLRNLQRRKYEQMMQEFPGLIDDYADEAWGFLTDETLPFKLMDMYKQWLSTGLRVVGDGHLQVLARQHESLIFEGSQGVLLDEWFGFHPYTTWSTTTSENALQLLSEIDHSARVNRLGILRAYTTRHGPGPFVTEDPGLATQIPEPHNSKGVWMGDFRYGHFDCVAHRYAIAANQGVDQLVVTGLDRADEWRYVDRYDGPNVPDLLDYFTPDQHGRIEQIKVGAKGDLDHQARLTELLQSCSPHFHESGTVDGSTLVQAIEDTLGVPVGIASYGPTAADKRVPVAY